MESMHTVHEGKKIWTVSSLIRWGSEYLEEKKFESPRLTVELLLAHVLGCQRIDLYLDFEKPMSSGELLRFKELFRRRLDREPLQYITGESHFMGLVFKVDRRVLIPRPETEILVERAIELLRAFPGDSHVSVLDIGTGSGNIAVSVAHYVKNVHVTATDVSDEALDVAGINAAQHSIGDRITFEKSDVFHHSQDLPQHNFDCILSNPPYITRDEKNTLTPDIIRYEPSIAVFDPDDGLTFFKRIAEVGKRLLKDDGWMLVETAYNQGSAVQKIFADEGYRSIQSFKDYDGNDRVVQSQLGE
jgi:release factor glutamine methyltransferase